MKIRKIFIIIAILVFVVYAIYYGLQGDDLLEKSGRYVIGTINKIEGGGGGGCSLKIYISFKYDGIEQKESYCEDLQKINESVIGKKVFLKIIPDNLGRKLKVYYNCSIPNNIEATPSEGWSQEWMQEHFPKCAR